MGTREEPVAGGCFAACDPRRVVAGEQGGGVFGDLGHRVLDESRHGVRRRPAESSSRCAAQQRRAGDLCQGGPVDAVQGPLWGSFASHLCREEEAQAAPKPGELVLAVRQQCRPSSYEAVTDEPFGGLLWGAQFVRAVFPGEEHRAVEQRQTDVLVSSGGRRERDLRHRSHGNSPGLP
jgi:hypothetical protein